MSAFDIFSQFAIDPSLELDGVDVPIGPATKQLDNGDADPASIPTIKVARFGNKRHSRIVSQLYEANKSTLELKNDAADAKGEEITIEAMAKAILLGWKNLSFKGATVADGWDYKQARTFLAIKDFRDLVSKHANDFTKYKAEQEKADLGN